MVVVAILPEAASAKRNSDEMTIGKINPTPASRDNREIILKLC